MVQIVYHIYIYLSKYYFNIRYITYLPYNRDNGGPVGACEDMRVGQRATVSVTARFRDTELTKQC